MQGRHVRGLVAAACLLGLASLSGCSAPQAPTAQATTPAPRAAPPKPPTPANLKLTADTCLRVRDLGCGAENLRAYLALRPTDDAARAQLAMVLHWANKDEEALPVFEKALADGEGSAYFFAQYAEALTRVGRLDDAIKWGYEAVAIDGISIDMRRTLARNLVARGRPSEALALLDQFDARRQAMGWELPFRADRLLIEQAVARQMHDNAEASTDVLQVGRRGRAYQVPVRVGDAPAVQFTVDTGATSLVMSEQQLASSQVRYAVAEAHAMGKLADGREITMRRVILEHVWVGPFQLRAVPALVCPSCQPLLGEDVLGHFDMVTSHKAQGDVLTLSRRR